MLAEPGYHTRAFVEWEDWPRAVIIAAQRAGYFAPAPIWTDMRSFDARPFRGAFDAVLAGYPCQPFSAAGKRGGADDPRHLWPDVARVIGECRPEWAFLENVAGHVTLGLETVLRELWGLGYAPAAGLFSAAEVGAPHERLRIFILAHTDEPAPRHWPLQPGREQRLHPESEALALGIAKALPNQWPTPAAQNWKGSSLASVTRTDGKSRMDLLHYRAEQGFTRPAPATLPDGPRSFPHAPISRPLWASMIASHGHAVSRRILKGRSRRRLNPLFVGWLMGWPIGHALCACSATEFTLWQQHMRGALSQLPMASGPWIWRPTDAAPRPAQMDFLEGLQP